MFNNGWFVEEIFTFVFLIPYYIFLLVLSWYIPGSFFFRHVSMDRFHRIILSTGIGMALWAWQGWIFAMMNMRWLSYGYIVVWCIWWVSTRQWKYLKGRIQVDGIFLFIVMLGVLIQIPAAWFNGLMMNGSLVYVGGHPPDFIWYAALTNALVQHIPPEQPSMAGEIVTNYHYWGHLIIAEIVRVFHAPLLPVLFQVFSIILSVSLGCSVLVFGQVLKLRRLTIALLLILLYFSGDVLPFITALTGQGFDFDMGSMEHGGGFLMNYPRAFSVVLAFVALSIFLRWLKRDDWSMRIAFIATASVVIGMKVNTGLFLLAGFGVLGCYYLFIRSWSHVWTLIGVLVCSLIVFLPANSSAGGMVFTGFWRSRDFIVHPELGLSHLELARQVFATDGKWMKALVFDGGFLLLFVIATYGVKVIGVFQTKRTLSALPRELHVVLISGMIISFIAGMFFIQESGGANSFSFIVTVFIFSSVYAATALTGVLGQITNRYLFAAVVVAVAVVLVPRSVYESYRNYRAVFSETIYRLPREEYNLYMYIKDNTPNDALFLTGTHHLSYIANRRVFTSPGYGNLILREHAIDPTDREMILKELYASDTAEAFLAGLDQYGITHMLNPEVDQVILQGSERIEKMYENDGYRLYTITRD